jgi:hypothetical protein
MDDIRTFAPAYGQAIAVTPGVASANSVLGKNVTSLCITSRNSVECFVRIGTGAGLAATSADYLVPPNGQVSISKFLDYDRIAYIALLAVVRSISFQAKASNVSADAPSDSLALFQHRRWPRSWCASSREW